MGRFEDGIKCYEMALQIYPKDIHALTQKGFALSEIGKYTEAVTVFDEALTLDPDNANILYQKGMALYNLEKYQEAIKCYDAALKLRPKYSEAMMAKQQAEYKIEPKIRQAVTEDVTRHAAEPKIAGVNYSKGQARIEFFKTAEPMRAVVIGINEYENTDIPILKGAENDVTELNKCLTNSSLGFKIAVPHYLQGREATYKNIRKAVDDVFRKYNDKTTNLILFYFSGHGFVDEETRQTYIAPYDFDPEDPESCGLGIRDLKDIVFRSGTGANVLVILDCCYAGIVKGTKGDLEMKNIYAHEVQMPFSSDEAALSQGTGKSRLLIASSEADNVSRERTICEEQVNPSPTLTEPFLTI